MAQRRERRTGRRRAGEAADPAAETIARIAQPVHRLPVYELASEEALHFIHRASLELLSDVGIDFYHPEAESILTAHGVRYVKQTATFDRELIAEYVAKALRTFTQLARNPARNVVIGGRHMTFAPVYGPPFVYDRDRVGQLARRHGLPFRSGGMFASSKVADAQAAYESVMVMLPAVLAQVNFVLHAAGWRAG